MSYRNSRRAYAQPDSAPILRSSSRRRVLQTVGMAGLASISLPWLRLRAAHAASDKTLRILQWSHFVPAYDTWFDTFARQWGEENGIEVSVDHINIVDLVTTTTSELSAGSGHDIIELGPEAAQFAPNVLDMADVNQEAATQFGTIFEPIKRVSYNPVVDTWYAFCHGWTIDCGDYRRSLWEKAGMPNGPDTWQDLLEVGEKIRQDQGVQVGIGMSQELDSNMVARSVLWSWGATVQDEEDNVILGHGKNRELAIDAVQYMVDLYKRTMTPAVFAWNPASNNQDLIAGKASYIINSISAYRSAQESRPDIARDVFFTGPLAGPRGDRSANVHVLYNYIIPKFAQPREDIAKQFILHLAKNYDQAMYHSKLYNTPSFFDTPIPGNDRGYPAVEGASTLKDLNDAWFADDPFLLEDEADGKLASLTTATEWTTNLGHPGYSSPAVGEVFNTFILPNMMAKAARGDLSPEEAVDEAVRLIEPIYAQWRERGLIGGGLANHVPPRKRNIAMVFQSYALYPHKNVAKNISFPLEALRLSKAEIHDKVLWAAQLFDIERLLGRKPRELSGGERQRVALARALVRTPQLFLMDEPLSNLDAKLRHSARREFKRLHEQTGITTLYVTHDQIEAMGLGERIAVMNEGKIHQIGTPHEIYHQPADVFVARFMGSPPMNLIPRGNRLMGFHAEDAQLNSTEVPEDTLVLPVNVQQIEYLGADALVYASETDSATDIILKFSERDGRRLSAGQPDKFYVPRSRLLYFDPQTGLRKER